MSRVARMLREGVRGLRANRVRSLFMMLGTFVGVGALIVLMAMGRQTQRDVLDRVEQMLGGSTILLRAGGSQLQAGGAAGQTTTLTPGDLDAVQAALPEVIAIDPVLMTRRQVTYGGRSADLLVEGHSEEADIAWSRSVSRGEFLSAADVAGAARVALVGEAVVEALFDGGPVVGEQIRIGGSPFRVKGVLERAGMDPHGIDRDRVIMVPISTMMRRVINVDYVSHAKLVLTPGTDLDLAVLDIADVLRRRHSLGPDQPNDFAMFTPVQVEESVREANRVFTLYLPLTATISILVGAFLVANLMLLTVNERRSEIGLRKAVGARAEDVRLQFLAESMAVTTLGGLAAVLAGFLALAGPVVPSTGPDSMPWGTAVIGIVVSVGVGLVSGLAPAGRAASLDPVRTLGGP